MKNWRHFCPPLGNPLSFGINMKTIRLLKVLAILLSSFWAVGQDMIPDEVRVDYSVIKKDLKTVIVELSEVSNVNITFNPNDLPKNKVISLSTKNKPLGVILNAILKGSDATYKIVGNQLVIVPDEFVTAKEIITISGYLRDSLSGEPLIYANIYNHEKAEGTNTNEYGFYSFSINKGVQRVYYSYLGYSKQILELKLKRDTTINVDLSPDAVLNEVLILDRQVDAQETQLYSADVLPVDKIWSISSLAGESDVLGLAHMMSGVSSGADGLGGLNVRGGSFDQNLILYDGVPVYNTSHALGMFSIFNPNTIKSAKLIKGSFPARYGGRLSSVFDVRTKDGSTKKLKGDVSLGAIAFRGSLEGPLGKNGSSFIVSYRRTHLDLWLLDGFTSLVNSDNSTQRQSDYSFYDLNGKLNFQLGKRNKLNISYYQGSDDLSNEIVRTLTALPLMPVETNQINSDWGNNILSVRLNSELSQKLYHNLTLYRSSFDLNNFDLQQFDMTLGTGMTRTYDSNLFQSSVRDLGLKSDFDFVPNTKNYFKFGFGAVNHTFSPGLITLDQNSDLIQGDISKDTLMDILNVQDLVGTELYVYGEDEIRFSDKVKANVGLMYNLVKTDSNYDHSIEPRLSLLVEGNSSFFRVGLSRMSQFLHLLSNGGFGLPSDVWIPSTDRIKPEKSWVFNAGFGFELSENFDFEIEGYYKKLDRVISFSEGVLSPIDANFNWQDDLPIGTGTAYGLEFNIHKAYGKSNIFANYTWSRSTRQFEDINFGDEYLFRFDRTHQFKFTLIQKLNKNAEFTSNLQVASGSPVSIPFEVRTIFDGEGNPVPVPVFEGRNLQNFPLYHRLDIGFNFYNDYGWAKQKFSVGLYNAYAWKNPYYIELGINENTPQNFQTYQFTILPLALPYISYSLSF